LDSTNPETMGASPKDGASRHPSAGLDPAVLDGVRRGEPHALGAFFDAYFDRIYALAHRLLGNRALAEDATQDVCYRIQRGAPRLDPSRDPTPWVMATTVNTCRSLWRSSGGRMERASRTLDDPEANAIATEPSLSPEAILLAKERRISVVGAVRDLEPSIREVVVLHDYEGMDHREIAAVLGLSHGAVRKRYSRGLAALAQRLGGILG
jgi:RNA polymerase sigma-70 factor (ECF subfamily)